MILPLALALLLAACAGLPAAHSPLPPQAGPVVLTPEGLAQAGQARQLMVVRATSLETTTAELRRFERDTTDSPWREAGPAIPVTIGRKGLAWGLGLHETPRGEPVKREGDGKAPAGAYTLGPAFGHAPRGALPPLAMDYLQITEATSCIEDPASAHYNRIVERDQTPRDWSAADDMRSQGAVYRLGLVVNHNEAASPGAGSCIFLHVWRAPGASTAGCTAMAEADMLSVLSWLDRAKHPLLVQWADSGPAPVP